MSKHSISKISKKQPQVFYQDFHASSLLTRISRKNKVSRLELRLYCGKIKTKKGFYQNLNISICKYNIIMKPLKSILLFCLAILVFSANKEEWRKRSIYQLLTDRFARNDGLQTTCSNLGNYCGGGYRGIISHLDYIQGMGFDAIWISPIIDNRDGGYHGYWGRNLYKLNDHFGTEKDFIDLVSACHARGILVMVDIVANHMGNLDTNYTVNTPFNNASHYHDYCEITDQDFATHNQARIQNCRLAKLADLKQENEYVKTTLLSWIKDLVTKYRIDGLRIDTVPQVPKTFWKEFSTAAGVYTVGQVFDGDMKYVGGYVGSLDAVLNYPFFNRIRDILFNQRDMFGIRNFYNDWGRNIDPNQLNYLANFCDNHDNARTLSWSGGLDDKRKHLKACNAMAMTAVGIPIVYYGTEQYFAGGNDPANREVLWRNLDRNSDMYGFISKINAARKKHLIWVQAQVERYADTEFFAFSRGKFLVCLTNKVSGGVQKFISYHPFTNGQVICNIFYPDTDCITVNGGFNVYLLNGQVKIYTVK